MVCDGVFFWMKAKTVFPYSNKVLCLVGQVVDFSCCFVTDSTKLTIYTVSLGRNFFCVLSITDAPDSFCSEKMEIL